MMKEQKLNVFGRWFVLTGVLFLFLTFFFPLWKIQLDAPQYPETLELQIWLDQIEGKDPNTLQNINILNHYIGMAKIEPDEIPELKFMPYIMGALILTGLAAAWSRRKKWVLGWLALFTIVGIAGFIDFYIWEYDYGHNLDPTAPIKIPGMNYQPPLVGEKVLLNITARSLPAVGGMILFFSYLMGWAGFFIDKFTSKEH